MAVFTMTQVKPIKLSTAHVRGYLLSTLQRQSKVLLRDYKAITKTWRHQPYFEVKVKYAAGNARLLISTRDRAFNVLEKGSGPRWAIMEKGFQPKTKVGWIGSQAGRGKAAVVGQDKMTQPRRPIEARRWNAAIAAKHRKTMAKEIGEAVMKGLRAGMK